MASRAPTLAKPKAKPKVTTKKIVAKPAPQSTVALKSVAKTSKATTKVAATKIGNSKIVTANVVTAKAPTKASVTKLAKPAASASEKIASSKITANHSAHKSPAKPKSIISEPTKISGTASFEAPAPKPRRRSKGEIRTRIYWAVFNQSLRRVAVFEFDQREEAEKRAAKLAQSTGEHHFLQKIKALVQ